MQFYFVVRSITEFEMNGLQITGIKLSSPLPSKKNGSIQTNKPIIIKKQVQKPKRTTSTVINYNNKQNTKKQIPINTKIQKKLTNKVQQKANVVNLHSKEQIKQEMVPKQQQPQQQVQQQKIQQVQEKIVEIAPFQVMVKYNHYKEKFATNNGILQFAPVNQKYSFALVFKGFYQPVLKVTSTREQVVAETTGAAEQWSWKVNQGQIYTVQIQQDQQEQAKYQRKAYRAPQKQVTKKSNQRVEMLTEQMKKMGITELGSEKHRQLLQQRDLQDILYS